MARLISLVAIIAIFLSGCSSFFSDKYSDDIKIAAIQYFPSSIGNTNETVEVLIANRGDKLVRFLRASLDGVELPPLTGKSREALRAFRFDGMVPTLLPAKASSRPVAGARWWQFYPSEILPAKGYCVFQINFHGNSHPCRLVLDAEDGRSFVVHIPRYTAPKRKLSFLSFVSGGRSVLAKLKTKTLPIDVCINGRKAKFAIFKSTDASSVVVEAFPDQPIEDGAVTLVEFFFPNGKSQFAFVRALIGVCLEAPFGRDSDQPLPIDITKKFNLDPTIRVRRFPSDAICSDVRAKTEGAMSKDVVGWRSQGLIKDPASFYGVDMCTALYPSAWNIYSQITDVVIVKPYKLHWSSNPQRFIEEEDEFIRDKVEESAPRPVEWVPERFNKSGGVSSNEFKELAWCAILRGVRGVRLHHWFNGQLDPFVSNPQLGDAIKEFCFEINSQRDLIERIVPIRSFNISRGRISVTEAWIPGKGVLLLVRKPVLRKARLEDHGKQKVESLKFDYPVPIWMDNCHAVDFLTGKAVDMECSSNIARLTLSDFNSFQLVFISSNH